MTSANGPTARTLDHRRADALERIAANHQFWLATGSDGRGPHLIPVAYVWDGTTFTTATFERSRTITNLRADPRARVAIGDTGDVVMIDVSAELIAVSDIDPAAADQYARVAADPRTMSGFVYLRLLPQRMQAWNGVHEFGGRTIMLNGRWLDQAAD